MLFALVAQLANGRNDRCGACAPGLLQLAVAGGFHELVDGHVAFLHLIAPVLQQVNDGVAGDTRQHRTVCRCRDHLAVDQEHDVHGSDFLHILPVHAIQPQHLLIAGLFRFLLRLEAAGIVAAAFRESRAAGRRADVFILDPDLDRVHATGIVRTGWRGNDDELVLRRRVNTHAFLRRKHIRTDVQRFTLTRGHPRGFLFHQGTDRIDKHIFGDCRHAHAFIGVDEPAGIHFRAEQLDRAVLRAVGLQAFKGFLRIVQHHARRGHFNGTKRHNGLVPPAAFVFVVFRHIHVVGVDLAESQRPLRLLLQRRSFFKTDIHDRSFFP